MIKTENGRDIDGVGFPSEPWVFWQRKTACAHCERCGMIAEIPDQECEPVANKQVVDFWLTHKACRKNSKQVESTEAFLNGLVVGKTRPKATSIKSVATPEPDPPQETTVPLPTVMFPPGNRIMFTQQYPTKNPDKTADDIVLWKDVHSVGIPPGLSFRLKSIDAEGAWLERPGVNTGPFRLWWGQDPGKAS